MNPSLDTTELVKERDYVMAVARHKLDYSGEDGPIHEQMMKTLYTKLIDGPF